MDKADHLRDWFRRVWVEGDLAAIPEFFQPGAQAEGLMPGTATAAGDFAALVPALRQHLLHPEITLLRHFACGDRLWALVEIRAQSASDLAPIRFDGQVMLRYEGGRIAEACHHFDLVALFEALGLLPRDTIALCLAGERIG